MLQISDAEETMGVIRTEAIQVVAEAYDVAVDIAFPKGEPMFYGSQTIPYSVMYSLHSFAQFSA